jgi:16S rRNA U516 pseudouridylate synthase RsuA-like enzyme
VKKQTLETMSRVITFALIDVVSEDMKLSKGKAKKAIRRGKVSVDGAVTRDPETRVHGDSKIVFTP